MRTIAFDVELLDDVVVSASGATAGGHRCLDYLPGAVFLGAAAGALYRTLGDDAFTAFHSGRVRFLPAFPLGDDGSLALPLPRSYHLEKYGALRLEDQIPSGGDPSLQNLARPGQPQMERPETIDGRFLTTGGTILRPQKRRTLKTAIDPATGRSQESQLFGYEALQAGNRFRAVIQADDDVPEALDASLKSALIGKVLRLGRSKRREYGRARTEKAELDPWEIAPRGSLLLLYFHSDAALTDPETGQPTLEPRAEQFGLGGAEVAWEHTFLRARRYSPINGKRLRPDLEHQVLAQGSVVAFRVAARPSPETLAKLALGVGAFRSEGLGQLLVDPPFLADRLPSFPGPARVALRAHTAAATAPILHELQLWAERQATIRQDRECALAEAGRWFEDLRPFMKRSGGPSRAQWGLIRERAAIAASGEALLEDLFSQAPTGPQGTATGLLRRGVRGQAWAIRHRGTSAVDRFSQLVAGCRETLRREAMLLLAARMQQELQKEDRR